MRMRPVLPLHTCRMESPRDELALERTQVNELYLIVSSHICYVLQILFVCIFPIGCVPCQNLLTNNAASLLIALQALQPILDIKTCIMFALTCYVYAQWSYIVYDYNNTDSMAVSGVVFTYNNAWFYVCFWRWKRFKKTFNLVQTSYYRWRKLHRHYRHI